MMNQPQVYNTFIHFKPGSSFADRERHLQQQIQQIKLALESKGYFPLEHQVNTTNDAKASVSVFYLLPS